VLGVDFGADALLAWRALGLPPQRSDNSDPQMALLLGLPSANYAGTVAVTVNSAADAQPYVAQGASLILTPFDNAASYVVERLSDLVKSPADSLARSTQ